MPAYSANPGDDEAMYTDQEGVAPEEAQETPAEESQEQESAEEARLPKAILAGKDFKPGDEIVLQITGIDEDSVRVKYAPEKGGYEEEGEGREMGRGPMGPPADEMAGMME